MATIAEKLDRLAELRAAITWHQANKDELKQAAIPDEVKDKLLEIDQEFDQKLIPLNTEITSLEFEIKQGVYARGETIKGDRLMAVFSKGRTTWDNKGLDLYGEIHPEVLEYRKIGEPSVSIREVK